jgi:hypothetical protein
VGAKVATPRKLHQPLLSRLLLQHTQEVAALGLTPDDLAALLGNKDSAFTATAASDALSGPALEAGEGVGVVSGRPEATQ